MVIHNFAVFEGGDGSGTTTQLEGLRSRFSAEAGFYATFEPTGGAVGGLIRRVLKGELSVHPGTLARLFAADRHEHLYGSGGIVERAGQGVMVISDRYVLSSLVYQGITCGPELPEALNAGFPVPELLLFFDIEPEIACRRIENRNAKEIYEYLEFQVCVRERYKALLPRYADAGVRVAVIDAAKPPEEVAEAVWRELRTMPIFKAL